MSVHPREGGVSGDGLVRRLSDNGLLVSEALERGQAELPLTEHFRRLRYELTDGTFTVCVLALSADARSELLRWLLDREITLFSVDAQTNLGLIDLSLRDGAYVVEGTPGVRREFDRLESFLDALKGSEAHRERDAGAALEPLRLAIPAARGASHIRLLICDSLQTAVGDGAVMNCIVRDCNVMLIAAADSHVLNPQDAEYVRTLAMNMDAVWPVVVATAETQLPNRGWWSDSSLRSGGHVFPICKLVPGARASLPPMFCDSRDPVRRALTHLQLARQFRAATDALTQRYEYSRNQLKARRLRDEKAEKVAMEGLGEQGRTVSDGLREYLSDELTALQRGVQENNRRALLAEGAISTAIETVLESLVIADLVRTSGHKVVTLTLADEYLAHLGQAIRRATHEQLSKDLVMLRDGCVAAQQEFERRVQVTQGVAQCVSLPPPDERTLRGVMDEVLRLQIRYKGELPRRGFLQRLSSGRRLLFGALMTISLFVSLVTGRANARNLLAPFGIVFIIVFVAGVTWTYSSWKKEDNERLEKELDKVREQLRTEVLRLVADSQREKLTRVLDHLDGLRRNCFRRLDELGRQISQQKSAETTRERVAARERLKLVDQRLRDLDSLRNTLQKIEQDSADLKRECTTQIANAARDASIR